MARPGKKGAGRTRWWMISCKAIQGKRKVDRARPGVGMKGNAGEGMGNQG